MPGPEQPVFNPLESLEELRTLAHSAGAEVEAAVLQARNAPDAATLVGSGKLAEIQELVAASRADMVLFDTDLTPTQQRNLERALDCKQPERMSPRNGQPPGSNLAFESRSREACRLARRGYYIRELSYKTSLANVAMPPVTSVP